MDDDFLSRWSRRKQQAGLAERALQHPPPGEMGLDAREADSIHGDRAGSADQPLAAPLDPEPASVSGMGVPAEAPSAAAELTDEEISALPPLESLSETSDLAPFLSSRVPSALRNAALRRIWSVDPSIRDFVSEAREYAYDWNCPGGVPGLGPLQPCDDVMAMVRRIFDGSVDAPEPDTTAPDQPAAESSELEATAPEAVAPPDIARFGTVVDTPSGRPDPVALAPAASGAGSLEPAATAASEPLGRPRLRRHGSAMPS